MAISPYIRELRKHIGHAPLLLPAVSVLVFNEAGSVLLHRSSDDGKWHTIGGTMEPNEEPAQAAIREVKEETGLDVVPEAVTGVYMRPPATYPNGDVCLYVAIAFKARIVGGELAIGDDESLELRFFSRDALPELDAIDRMTVDHAFDFQGTTWFAPPGHVAPDL